MISCTSASVLLRAIVCRCPRSACSRTRDLQLWISLSVGTAHINVDFVKHLWYWCLCLHCNSGTLMRLPATRINCISFSSICVSSVHMRTDAVFIKSGLSAATCRVVGTMERYPSVVVRHPCQYACSWRRQSSFVLLSNNNSWLSQWALFFVKLSRIQLTTCLVNFPSLVPLISEETILDSFMNKENWVLYAAHPAPAGVELRRSPQCTVAPTFHENWRKVCIVTRTAVNLISSWTQRNSHLDLNRSFLNPLSWSRTKTLFPNCYTTPYDVSCPVDGSLQMPSSIGSPQQVTDTSCKLRFWQTQTSNYHPLNHNEKVQILNLVTKTSCKQIIVRMWGFPFYWWNVSFTCVRMWVRSLLVRCECFIEVWYL